VKLSPIHFLLQFLVVTFTAALFITACGGSDVPAMNEDGDVDTGVDSDNSDFNGIVTEAYSFPEPLLTIENAQRDDRCRWSIKSEVAENITINACGSLGHNGTWIKDYEWMLTETPTTALDGRYLNPGPEPCIVTLSTPVTGRYTLQVKVRDSNDVWSDHPFNTSSCQYAYFTVSSSSPEGISAELVWDKGERLDMDLFLVRYRPCGTMGYSTPLQDIISPPAITLPDTCTDSSDCMGLPCVAGYCNTSCMSTQDCQQAHPAWYCGPGNVCQPLPKWYCKEDSDCAGEGYCSPRNPLQCEEEHICTRHPYEAISDSCSYNNAAPDWGEMCDTTDNPRLLIDDIDGFGPEHISYPQPVDGLYRVVARVYNDPNEIITTPQPLQAWVTIFLHGQKCGQWSARFARTSTYWKVADIQWDGMSTSCTDIKPIAPQPEGAHLSPELQCENPEDRGCAWGNPFRAIPAGLFDPCHQQIPRSIWCDYEGDSDCIANGDCCPVALP